MLDREWVSLTDPDDPYARYVFDVSFLLSRYTCIYGAGCPGTDPAGPDPVRACCRHGAFYIDEDDQRRTEAMVDELGPEFMQHYDHAKRHGVTATSGHEARTRVHDGACIFQNREGFATGMGCALHHYAVARGEHLMTYKPEVCWMVPLRREFAEDVADDGEPLVITTITSFDRGAWGPGGAEFSWWCTEEPEAFVGDEPVYLSMGTELKEMVGPRVYAELATYLEQRRAGAPKPLAFPLFVNGQRQ